MVWGVAQPRCRFGRLLVIITRRDERCVGEVMACYLPRTALGNMLKAEGRNVEAEAALRAATRVDPTFADACYNLGDLLDEQGRSEAAIECLSTALRVAPDYADAMFNLALLLQRKNQFAEAVDYWRRYLASDVNLNGLHGRGGH